MAVERVCGVRVLRVVAVHVARCDDVAVHGEAVGARDVEVVVYAVVLGGEDRVVEGCAFFFYISN